MKELIDKIMKSSASTICTGIVVFFLLLWSLSPILCKVYSGEKLLLEVVILCLYTAILIPSFLRYYESKLTSARLFFLGIFCSFLFLIIRDIGMSYFISTEILPAERKATLLRLLEYTVLISFVCVAAVNHQERKDDLINRNFAYRLYTKIFSAIIFISVIAYILFFLSFGWVKQFNSMGQAALIVLIISQITILAAEIVSLFNVIEKKDKYLYFGISCSLLFLFVSNIYFVNTILGKGGLEKGLFLQVLGLSVIYLSVMGKYRELLQEGQQEVNIKEDIETAVKKRQEEIDQRSRVLREKTIESQEVSRVKSELLANMSHELRTPMNSIIGFTTRVIKKTEGIVPEQQIKNLHTIERNAYHLLGLINTILDVSKIEAGRMEIFVEEFPIAPLINEVAEMGRSLLGGKEVAIKEDLQDNSIVLKSDRLKVKQMLVNLMGNAVKFTERGSITISLRRVENIFENMDKPPCPGILLGVADTGIGIKEENIKFIFDEYSQVDGSLTRKTGGTGLGLTLVKRFSTLLGGNTTVESEYQSGAKFIIHLPYESSKHIKEEKPEQKSVFEKSMQTLVQYEPQKDAADVYSSFFQAKGFEIRSVAHVDDAFVFSKEKHPRLVLLDLLSIDKKGLDLVKKFKSNYYTKTLDFCATGLFDNCKHGYVMDIIDIEFKPVTKEMVSRILNNALQRKNKLEDVLVIDNDESALRLYHDLIHQEGNYRVRIARNMHDVNNALKNIHPDVAIMNLLMPACEGYRIAYEFWTKRKWCEIPVILAISKDAEKTKTGVFYSDNVLVPKKGELKREEVCKKIMDIIGRSS